MTEARIEIRMSNQEKEQLRIEADKCDYSLSDYIRKKLLDDNVDIYDKNKMKFITPSGATHEAVVAVSVKTIEETLIKIMGRQFKIERREALDVIEEARDNAKKSLKTLGYHIIKPENN
jgi:hypothetical protein